MHSTKSTTGEKHKNFTYQTLMVLNDKLTSDDLMAIKFLCSDLVTKKSLSKLRRPSEVMHEVGGAVRCHYDPHQLLLQLLKLVGRLDIIRLLGLSTDSELSTSLENPETISNYRLVLHNVAESMGPIETEEMKVELICRGIQGLKEITDPYELFLKLEPKHLNPSNINLLLEIANETESLCDLKVILQEYNPPQIISSTLTDREYPCKASPRGLCLIINNENFHPTGASNSRTDLTDRLGTSKDKEKLVECFMRLNFNVKVCTDLTSIHIKERIKQTAAIDHSGYDVFVCCILTHGENGVVYGIDCVPVTISYITQKFSPQFCPTLQDKPKIFLIQACQGSAVDELVDGSLQYTDGTDRDYIPSSLGPASEDFSAAAGSSSYDESTESAHDSSIHNDGAAPVHSQMKSWKYVRQPDFLIGLATVPGYVAFRSTSRGSWYIQALCETLTAYHNTEDLLSMLTIVNNKVHGMSRESHGRQCIQIPLPTHTFRKKLFLRT